MYRILSGSLPEISDNIICGLGCQQSLIFLFLPYVLSIIVKESKFFWIIFIILGIIIWQPLKLILRREEIKSDDDAASNSIDYFEGINPSIIIEETLTELSTNNPKNEFIFFISDLIIPHPSKHERVENIRNKFDSIHSD